MRPIWIFDLDDTLHDASAHIFPHLNRAMTQYIMDTLAICEADAHALRQRYWRIYGATLKGLMRHHGTDPYHFLVRTHELMNLQDMVVHAKRLRHALQRLPGRKVVFTNAPMQYALRVLRLIGVEDMFEIVHSVESTRFHPKPSVRGFQSLLRTLHVNPAHCIMVEDNLPALRTARRLGMKAVHITRALHKPCYVSARLNSVLALTRHTI